MAARSLQVIAFEIRKDWKNPYFGAKPYIEAMCSLEKITDNHYHNSAESVVRYFLANAGKWRGEVARRIKAELKEMLKNVEG